MPSRRHRNLIVALVILLVLGLLGALIDSGGLTIRQKRVPAIPLPTALPAIGDNTSIHDSAGKPLLTFLTSDYEPAATPTSDKQSSSRMLLTITNRSASAIHIRPAAAIALVDTWGARRPIDVINDSGQIVNPAAFDLGSTESRALRLSADLPPTDQPALLIWSDGADFAVLTAFNGVVPAVGQPLLASAKPTLVTSWLAVPAGILTITDLNSNARTTARGPKLWNKDRQYASLTVTFRNTQSGRFRWSPDSVTIVDQLGRGYQSRVDATQAPANTATPPPANSALIPPNSTVRLSVEYKVPLGTEIRYVVISEGASMTVVAATGQSADDPNLAYNNDLVQMLDLAASKCVPYSGWSGRAHTALAGLDSVLTTDLAATTPLASGDLRAQAQTLATAATTLPNEDTPTQAGFSESEWLASILSTAARTLTDQANAMEPNPGVAAVDPAALQPLLDLRDQFATRLTGMDSFFSTGCGDIVNNSATPVINPSTPEPQVLA